MIDDQDLLDRFHEFEAPATRLTAETLVTAGRRRQMRRRAWQAACGVALTVGALVAVPQLLPGTGHAPPVPSSGKDRAAGCVVSPLPVPAGMTNVWAEAVDPTGRYIVGHHISGERDTDPGTGKATGTAPGRPVLWTDGRATVLAAPLRAVQPTGVNAAGVVVAVAGDRGVFDSVLRYVGGVPQKAVLPAGSWDLRPYAKINAGGDVLITANPLGKRDTDAVVMLWKAGSAAAVKLPLPAGADGKALTDSGAVVGDLLTGPDGKLSSYVWDQRGRPTRLAAPEGQSSSVNTGRGDWAIGNLWPSGQVARWNLRTGEMTLPDLNTPARAVNNQGWLLADDTLRRDDAVVKLPPAASGSATDSFSDVADDGTVVGSTVGEAGGRPDLVSLAPISWRCGLP